LDHWEKKQHGCVRCLAYALATATWETRTTMQPIEVGVEAGEDPRFRGRGYLPCAGQDFYRRASTLCGIDLVAQPEALLEPPVAAEVLFAGLMAGTFTGVPLTDYLGPTQVDWVGARHAVGTMDAALKTANLVRVYWVALQGASIRPDGESTEPVDLGSQTLAATDGVTASTRR
jgi:hypothetical protein